MGRLIFWAGLVVVSLVCGVALSESRTTADAPSGSSRSAGSPVVRGDPVAGARDFARYCESCHGQRGEGDGLLAPTLDPQPPRLSDPGLLEKRTDAELLRVIEEGSAALGRSDGMAAWKGTLTPSQIENLIAFIRALQRANAAAIGPAS